MCYLFTSSRLGFRNWQDDDMATMAAINSDNEVMKYFPATLTSEETFAFVTRMKIMFGKKGYCYFAVDQLADEKLIGFIGLCDQTYEADFTPCVDIGWRLDKKFWNKGYATEGAKRCISYGFVELGLQTVIATAPVINAKSIHVMDKLGMAKRSEFIHPKLSHDKRLERCVCYELGVKSYRQ